MSEGLELIIYVRAAYRNSRITFSTIVIRPFSQAPHVDAYPQRDYSNPTKLFALICGEFGVPPRL